MDSTKRTRGRGQLKRVLSCIIALIVILTSIDLNSIEIKAAETWNFGYTGGIQSFTVPYTGSYFLECYGASGGLTAQSTYGWGGYSAGYYNLKQGQTIYIVVGGQGARNSAGGYNGGGAAYNGAYSGGGATHIALRSGLLKNLVSYKSSVLCVAGGGGGAGSQGQTTVAVIGAGGGTIGSGSNYQYTAGRWVTFATESTQTSGYAFGQGQDYCSTYSDSYGGGYGGAGGGGWYGGYQSFSGFGGGSGGSGYTDALYNIRSSTGVHKGNGSARITYNGQIQTTLTIEIDNGGYWNGNDSKVQIKGNWSNTLNLGQLQIKSGWTLQGWEVLLGDGTVSGNTFTFGMEDTTIRAKWKAPLTLTSSQSGNKLRLDFKQPDGQPKIFKVYQSLDKSSWNEIDNADQGGSSNVNKNFSYTGAVQTYVAPFSGLYTVSLWGAQGGDDRYSGGLGGYVKGQVYLEKGETVYIYVGGKGGNSGSNGGGMTQGGWNGGGNGGKGEGAGGGATDIRIGGTGNGYNNSTDNRVMVAGGGGGSGNWAGEVSQGADGGLTLAENCKNGKFKGQDAESARDGQGAGGGGGYYGGKKKVQGWGDYGAWGGTNYIASDVIAIENQSGQRQGNGYASIEAYANIIMENYITDITLYDKAAPTTPSNGSQSRSGDTVRVSFTGSTDRGTTFYHKVVSYKDVNLSQVVSESTVVENTYTSGLRGYYYYFDSNANGTVTKTNSTFTTSRTLNQSLRDNNGNYFRNLFLHVAAVDNAGNLGATYTYKINTIYEVIYDKNDTTYNINGNRTSTTATGSTSSTTAVMGDQMTLANNGFSKKGYTFDSWNTKSDGTGTKFTAGQKVTFEQLGSNITTTLYAIWKPNEYTVTIHGNGNWNNKGDVVINTEFDKTTKIPNNPYTRNPSDNKVVDGGYKIREPWEFIGWSQNQNWQPGSSSGLYGPNADITNVIDGSSTKNYDLYAIWRKTITLTLDLTGGYKNEASDPIVLKATIYNSTDSYTFGLTSDGNLKVNAYGAFDSDGINSMYKKFSTEDESILRFLGWATDNSNSPIRDGTIQGNKANLFTYDTSGRSKQIKLYDSLTLKACWESVLQLSAEVGRTLGNLEYEDGSQHILKVNNLKSYQTTTPVVLKTIVRPGEQGFYSIRTANTNDDTVTVIKFDSSIIDIYNNGDASSTWYDNLNPVADNPLDENQKHGLDRGYIGEQNYISNKWFTPNYFGTDKSYETSIGKESYTFTITVSQPSVYWEYMFGKEETVNVKVQIDVTSKTGHTPGEDDNGHAPGGGDTTLDELRTRLKIRLL